MMRFIINPRAFADGTGGRRHAPPKEEEDIYQAWECPQFRVIRDHTPSYDESSDGMPLKIGQVLYLDVFIFCCMETTCVENFISDYISLHCTGGMLYSFFIMKLMLLSSSLVRRVGRWHSSGIPLWQKWRQAIFIYRKFQIISYQ